MAPTFELTLITNTQGIGAISKNFVEYLIGEVVFSKVCVRFAIFKLSLAIILPIVQVVLLFEQTLIIYT